MEYDFAYLLLAGIVLSFMKLCFELCEHLFLKLVSGLLGRLATLSTMLLVNGAVALILGYFGYTMSWFSYPPLLAIIYGCPAVLVCFMDIKKEHAGVILARA